MNNADQPAHPTFLYDRINGVPNGHRQGLTKRELIAAMALQGLCANTNVNNDGTNDTAQFYAATAIKLADELLKQLETK